MEKFRDIFEAKPLRAWSNKITKIDNLMSWMYSKDILNKGEKNDKDKIFRQYYRYYNDGDFPRGLRSKGLTKMSPKEEIQMALEEYLEAFIKRILTKYLPKVNRTKFRYDHTLSEIKNIKNVVDRMDIHGLVTYWGPKFKSKVEGNDKFFKKVLEINVDYVELVRQIDIIDSTSKSYGLTYRREQMMDSDTWTPFHEKRYNRLQVQMKYISIILKDLETSVLKMKELLK